MKTITKNNSFKNAMTRLGLFAFFMCLNAVSALAQNKQTFDTRGNTGAQQIGALIDQYYYIAEIVCALYVVGMLISIAYKILGEQQQASFKMFMNPLIAIGLIFFIIPAIINAVFG
jgi:hypothetical protein